MIKCYEVPVLFSRSSEEEISESGDIKGPIDEERMQKFKIGTFVVMFYEKIVRKRTYAKTPG